jgi:hypothetical protein
MAVQTDSRVQDCIERCQRCQQFCLETINKHLGSGSTQADAEDIRMMMACVEICSACVRFMLLGSPLMARVCGVCAEVCDACSKECGRMKDVVCADVCRQCADSCRAVAQA